MSLSTKYRVYFYDNGDTAVEAAGEPLDGLRESWFLLYVDMLKAKGIDPTECAFFLPGGWIARVADDGKNWTANRADIYGDLGSAQLQPDGLGAKK